jgi:hypothetical protein
MADKTDKEKDKKDKKGKKKGKGADGGAGKGGSVATHPRAAAAVRRAKGFGGLGGFALAALLSHRTGLAASGVLERALIAGVAGYVIAWGCAVTVWRHLLLAEMRAAIEHQRELLADRRTIPLTSGNHPTEAAPAAPASPAQAPAG